MHVPPGYALFIPSAIRKAVDLPGRRRRPVQGPAAGRAGAGRGPLRPRRRGAGPDRRRRLRGQGPRRRHRRDPPVPVVQPGVRRAHGPQPLARLHREPAHRAGRRPASAPPARRRRRQAVLVVGAGPAGLQAAIAAARNGHDVTVCEKEAAARRPGAAGGDGAEPGRARRPRAQPAGRVPPARRARSSTASACGPGWSTSAAPTTSSWPPAPSRPARGGCRPSQANVCDVRDVLDGSGRARSATSSSSTRSASTTPPRWPSCWPTAAARSRSSPTAWWSGQDLGITLDMEGWWMRAGAKGIVQSTDLVPMGMEGRTLKLLHHPTGIDADRARPTGSCWPCRPTRSSGSTST